MDPILLTGLFGVTFLAGSIMPFPSEAAVAAALLERPELWGWILTVATLGNTAGGVANWILGRWVEHFRDRTWFPVGPAALAAAQVRFQRYGWWSLALAWVPVIGDPLTVIAGVMRIPLLWFVAIVGLGKFSRYYVVAHALA